MRTTTRLLLLCLLLVSGGLQIPSGAQDNTDVLTREGDEHVATLDGREQTIAILLSAVETARANGDSVKAARYLNRVGRLQLLLTHADEALKTYQDALNTINNQDAATKIASLNGVAAAHGYMSNCADAKPFSDDAIELSNQTHNDAGKAQALLTLSECQVTTDQLLALKTAQEALELWKSVNNKWGIGKTYSAIGYYQLTLQNVNESEQSHRAALAIWRELKIPYEEAQALINLGFVEMRKAEWQNAISFLLQGQDLLDAKTYPFEMGQITITLGEIFTETGLSDAAIYNLQEATKYFGQTKNPQAITYVSLDMAKAYFAAGKYDDAIATSKATITEAEKINEPNIVGMCHEVLGQAFVALNDPATALGHFETALTLFTKSSRIMEAARVRARMGQVYALQKKFPNANTYYAESLKTFQMLSDRLNESATLYAIGKLRLDQQDLDGAEEYLRRSIEVTEDIRRAPTTSDLTAAFAATIHDRYQSYIDCLMRKKKTRSANELAATAFELSEKGRGRSLMELLQATQTSLIPGLDRQLAQREQSLRQSLTIKQNYKISLLSKKYDPKELAALDAELAQLERDYKQLDESLGKQFVAYGRLRQAELWDLKRIQEQVIGDEDTVLLEYSVGADRSYAWAVTRNDIVSYELAPETELTAAANKVYKLMSVRPATDPNTELQQASNELSKLVLAPVADSLGKRRIIVVADDVLHYIPFQALPDPAGKAERMIDAHEIVNAPSASILGELRQETARRQPAARVLAAFGNPVFASNYLQVRNADAGDLVADLSPDNDRWRHALRDIKVDGDAIDPTDIQPLFYTTRELSNLREIAGEESLLLTGFEATRESLNNLDLTQFAILHFATHGVLDPRNPENSGFFLSMVNRNAQKQNGFIGLQDVYALKARVDLVVLSACRTGLGKDVKGEGLIGLTRGFMHAGASSTVASLWSVDDEATAELMKNFYANMLQKKMTPSNALREAQSTIRKDPRWSSPYYWAAFTFQGDYDHHISAIERRSSNKLLLLGSIVGLLLLTSLVGYWWFRRVR
jgi:CHAT domain-containing protein